MVSESKSDLNVTQGPKVIGVGIVQVKRMISYLRFTVTVSVFLASFRRYCDLRSKVQTPSLGQLIIPKIGRQRKTYNHRKRYFD